MKVMLNTGWKILKIGGWVPLFVFTMHLFLSRVVHAYDIWPTTDIPMHFSGGMAIAFFISRCFQLLPREVATIKRSRIVLLEILLMISLTATAAVFWEYAEFTIDQVFGTNIQISLANTMQDLAMGISGAFVFSFIRSRQLHVGHNEIQEITSDWVYGQISS
jgi:hypothetical protein